MSGETRWTKDGVVARILFDRPEAYNALTWDMWRGLGTACAAIAADPEIRVVTLRGAGGKAFVSGTDIAGFQSFTSGAEGVAYEAEMDSYVGAVEALPQPTIAIVDGWAVGGGLALSFACDFRIAATGARFGSPLARTIGNCLSARGYARLVQHAGIPIAKRMLLAAEIVPAAELHALGLVNALVEPDAIDATVAELVDRLAANAPLTQRVSKEAIRRLSTLNQPDIDDLVATIYGSADFAEGVRSFLAKEKPVWRGR
ncbi:enoyl-CoA hydratase [Sphingomonas nostoxanthinifaciens]|uniref:enoyl-CoA hydratase n=1 Tax=Sphingomonas nostoxanthinifaciens TaxID=2872652 RepID=UPI001CC20069|nr:enoyl-CoA hydratase [Sphingomonas nostoxanthinifaciens]UAK23276.1 enoyl-CoA hydratase/isomerase family protein [Sphingomonas nostoxanthinifaciens]